MYYKHNEVHEVMLVNMESQTSLTVDINFADDVCPFLTLLTQKEFLVIKS